MRNASQTHAFRTDTIHAVDSIQGARNLPDDSVDCVVTSPPYWGLRDYGVGGQMGLERHPQEWVDKMVELCRLLRPKLTNTGTMWWNIGETYYGGNSGHDYRETKGLHKDQCLPGIVRRVTRNQEGTWLQPKQLLGLPWRFANALQDDGWILRNAIIWQKPNHMPSSVKDRFATSYEYIFFFVKSRKYWFDLDALRVPHETPNPRNGVKFNIRVRDAQRGRLVEKWGRLAKATSKETTAYNEREYARVPTRQDLVHQRVGAYDDPLHAKPFHSKGKNPGDIWRITTKPHPFAHFAVFPEDLPTRCIKAGCPEGGVVLDPFMGSGTTALAALKLKRHYIGFELNLDYVRIAHDRIKRALE